MGRPDGRPLSHCPVNLAGHAVAGLKTWEHVMKRKSKAQAQRDENTARDKAQREAPKEPQKPAIVDPFEGYSEKIREAVNDPDISRNALVAHIIDLLGEFQEEVREQANKEGFEVGLEQATDESREGVCEALSLIGRDWETGRNLLERALGGKIFGLGTTQVEVF